MPELEFGFDFDFDEQAGVDEGADFDHGGAGLDGVEEFTVGAAVLLPELDVGDEHAGSDDVFESGAELGKGAFNGANDLNGLGIGVACGVGGGSA